jgi:hypothetical protein
MRSYGERELVSRKQDTRAFFAGKIKMLVELRQRRNSIFELPFPIVPEFRRDIRPVPWRMRNEGFP